MPQTQIPMALLDAPALQGFVEKLNQCQLELDGGIDVGHCFHILGTIPGDVRHAAGIPDDYKEKISEGEVYWHKMSCHIAKLQEMMLRATAKSSLGDGPERVTGGQVDAPITMDPLVALGGVMLELKPAIPPAPVQRKQCRAWTMPPFVRSFAGLPQAIASGG